MQTLEFLPLTRNDFALLRRWLLTPHVREWWRDEPTEQYVEQQYGPVVDGTDPTRAFTIRLDGVPIGLIQSYRHVDEPDWDRLVGVPDAAGIDYLIGAPEHCGRGVGTAVLAEFAKLVLDRYPDIATVVAAPQRDNRASCRALEKAGFTLLETRDLQSDDPSDFGVSAIYVLPRHP